MLMRYKTRLDNRADYRQQLSDKLPLGNGLMVQVRYKRCSFGLFAIIKQQCNIIVLEKSTNNRLINNHIKPLRSALSYRCLADNHG